MKPSLVFVTENGDQRTEYVVRVDHALMTLAFGVLCSMTILVMPLLLSVPQSQVAGASRQEVSYHRTQRSGIDAGRTALAGWLARL